MGNCLSSLFGKKQPDGNQHKYAPQELNDVKHPQSTNNGTIIPPLPARPEQHQQTEKKHVRALFEYVPQNEDDISFGKDEILELLDDSGPWWKARNRNNQVGMIPSNYVQLHNAGIQSLEGWFKVDRREAERNLLLPGQPDGTYVVRPSSQQNREGEPPCWALSIRVQQGANHYIIKHYKIKSKEDGSCYIAPRLVFPTAYDLIEHYRIDKDGLCHQLTQPCERHFRPPVEFRDIEVSREAFTLMDKLGSGSFGDVWRAKWNRLVEVAIKTIKADAMEKEAFIQEAELLHQLRHEKIVQILGVCTKEEPMYIITELMINGSLLSYIKKDAGSTIDIPQIVDMLFQISDGMKYLEEKNYLHRDLRAANILVGDNHTVKVSDFGLAKMMDDDIYSPQTSVKFPVKWTSPEAFQHSIFSVKSDVWSFGVLIYEMVTFGAVPYPGMTNREVMEAVGKQGYRMPMPTGPKVKCDEGLYQKMIECWQDEPLSRPTFHHLYDFFENYTVSNEVQYQ